MSRGSLQTTFARSSLCALLAACSLDSRQVDVSAQGNQPGAAGAAGLGEQSEEASAGSQPNGAGAAGADSSGDSPGNTGAQAGSATSGSATSSNSPPACADGVLGPEEACDDGNRRGGDGCSLDCARVEPSFSCPRPGQPCMPFVRCGDGIVALVEQCDDGNQRPGDGCSELCTVAAGKRCEGEPSTCRDAICGNGLREGSEGCDDGNSRPFDGCSAQCQREPSCVGGVDCQSDCGDGFAFGEACDDGNLLDGDGCSAACEIEAGSVCSRAPSCNPVAGVCVQRLPLLLRDFANIQPDFGNNSCNALATGAVSAFLDATARPTLSTGPQVTEACLSTPANFAAWFSDAADRPTLPGELTLFDDGAGGYVNRFGFLGEPFQAAGTFDGTPLFFPVDSVIGGTAQLAPASIPVQYGVLTVTAESTLFPGAPNHNFAFTSEMALPFAYDFDTQGTLTIGADDDVWVFINGRLALDLGGVHEPITGSIRIDAATSVVTVSVLDGVTPEATFPVSDFGLVAGMYRFSIFHAEREPPVSSLLLKTTGFAPTPSQCRGICGDATLGAQEECDDGINDGGYGECEPGCLLGSYCGDGTTQPEFGETCDVGSAVSPTCRGCRILPGG